MNPQRKWTFKEDELIRRQPHNGLSVWKLERMLRAKTETIELRARQLGVTLLRKKERSKPPDSNEAKPIRVPRDDPLLKRLRKLYAQHLTERPTTDRR